MSTLYEDDIVAWSEAQEEALRAGAWEALDITNLLAELEALRDKYRIELENRLRTLLEHLLKLAYAPPHVRRDNRRLWALTCTESRHRITRRLAHTRRLARELPGMLPDIYEDARLEVLQRLEEFDDDALPATCPWSLEDVRREDYFPV